MWWAIGGGLLAGAAVLGLVVWRIRRRTCPRCHKMLDIRRDEAGNRVRECPRCAYHDGEPAS